MNKIRLLDKHMVIPAYDSIFTPEELEALKELNTIRHRRDLKHENKKIKRNKRPTIQIQD